MQNPGDDAPTGFGATVKAYRPRYAAMTFQSVWSRPGRSSPAMPTLNLEAAYWGQRQPDWANKITLQVTPRELPDFVACLTGFLDSATAGFHGDTSNNKSYELRNSGRSIRLSEPGRAIEIELTGAERYRLIDLALSRLQAAGPDGTPRSATDVLNTLRVAYR